MKAIPACAKFWIRLIKSGLALLALLTSFSTVQAGTLEHAEEIMAKFENIDNFLISERPEHIALREEYYAELASYFGGENRFPRQSFDAVLAQARRVASNFSKVKAKLWDTGDLGSAYSITPAGKSYGKKLADSQKLDSVVDAWIGPPGRQPVFTLAARAEYAKKLSAEIELFQGKIAGQSLTKKQRAEETADFFMALTAREEVKAMGASYAYDARGKLYAVSKDVDDFIEAVQGLYQNPGQLLVGSGLSEAEQKMIAPFLKPHLKPLQDMLDDPKYFVPVTRVTNQGKVVPVGVGAKVAYEFKPIPRRIHGIWKGISLGECVGGNCNSLDSLTPERWGTVLLDRAQLHNVEQGGRYLGFVQLVPVRSKKNGRIYASVDFGANVLSTPVSVADAEGKKVKKTLYSHWLPVALKKKPEDWVGFVVGKSRAINNAGVLSTVHDDPSYAQSAKRLGVRGVEHFDPMTARKLTSGGRAGYAQDYGGNMILDATVPDAGDLTVLQPDRPDGLRDWNKLASAIRRVKGQKAMELLVNAMQANRHDGANLERLARLVSEVWPSENVGRFLEYLEGMAINRVAENLRFLTLLYPGLRQTPLAGRASALILKGITRVSWNESMAAQFQNIATEDLRELIVDSLEPHLPYEGQWGSKGVLNYFNTRTQWKQLLDYRGIQLPLFAVSKDARAAIGRMSRDDQELCFLKIGEFLRTNPVPLAAEEIPWLLRGSEETIEVGPSIARLQIQTHLHEQLSNNPQLLRELSAKEQRVVARFLNRGPSRSHGLFFAPGIKDPEKVAAAVKRLEGKKLANFLDALIQANEASPETLGDISDQIVAQLREPQVENLMFIPISESTLLRKELSVSLFKAAAPEARRNHALRIVAALGIKGTLAPRYPALARLTADELEEVARIDLERLYDGILTDSQTGLNLYADHVIVWNKKLKPYGRSIPFFSDVKKMEAALAAMTESMREMLIGRILVYFQADAFYRESMNNAGLLSESDLSFLAKHASSPEQGVAIKKIAEDLQLPIPQLSVASGPERSDVACPRPLSKLAAGVRLKGHVAKATLGLAAVGGFVAVGSSLQKKQGEPMGPVTYTPEEYSDPQKLKKAAAKVCTSHGGVVVDAPGWHCWCGKDPLYIHQGSDELCKKGKIVWPDRP